MHIWQDKYIWFERKKYLLMRSLVTASPTGIRLLFSQCSTYSMVWIFIPRVHLVNDWQRFFGLHKHKHKYTSNIPYWLASYARPQAAFPLLFRHRQQSLTPAPPSSWQQPLIFIFETCFFCWVSLLFQWWTFLPSQMIPSASWSHWAFITDGGDSQAPNKWSYCKSIPS